MSDSNIDKQLNEAKTKALKVKNKALRDALLKDLDKKSKGIVNK